MTQPIPTPDPRTSDAEMRENSSTKTDAQIVAEVNDLAHTLLSLMGTGYTVPPGFRFYAEHKGERPAIRAVRAWNAAVIVYEQITGTEVADALEAFMEGEGAVEAEAERIYELARRKIVGRPAWGTLDLNDPYDAGMRDAAVKQARINLSEDPAHAR